MRWQGFQLAPLDQRAGAIAAYKPSTSSLHIPILGLWLPQYMRATATATTSEFSPTGEGDRRERISAKRDRTDHLSSHPQADVHCDFTLRSWKWPRNSPIQPFQYANLYVRKLLRIATVSAGCITFERRSDYSGSQLAGPVQEGRLLEGQLDQTPSGIIWGRVPTHRASQPPPAASSLEIQPPTSERLHPRVSRQMHSPPTVPRADPRTAHQHRRARPRRRSAARHAARTSGQEVDSVIRPIEGGDAPAAVLADRCAT